MSRVELLKPACKLRLLLVEENPVGEDPTVWEMDYDGFALPGDPRHAPEKLQVWLAEHSMAVRETCEAGEAELAGKLTEIERAREALQESESRLAGIQSAMDAIVRLDAEQRIVMFNPAAEKMFGLPAAEAMGRGLGELMPARFRSAHAGQVRTFGETTVTERSMGGMEPLYALRADGTEYPAEISISPSGTGKQRLFTAIVRDIAERRRAEENLLNKENHERQSHSRTAD